MAKRRSISVGGGDLHVWADEAWGAVVERNDPTHPEVVLHGTDLARMADGELKPFNVASFRERLSRVAVFYTVNKEEEKQPKPPPRDVAEALLSRAPSEYEGAARIERITDVPVVTEAGNVLSAPGYHAAERVYHRPAEGLEGLSIPGPGEVTTVEEVEAARDFLLDDWLGEFGFYDEASRANALAELLTPFVRDLIRGGTPLFPVIAPQFGWGKGLLTDACLMPGCGLVAKEPATDSEEEMRKRVTSALRALPSAIVFDNLTGRLDSQILANVLTTGKWKDRLLGESRDLEVEPRNVWTANGNNFTLSGELVERCPAPILLGRGPYWQALCERKGWDAEVRPRERPRSQFAHADYLTWACENRARAVEAAFVLIRHWLDGPVMVVRGSEFQRLADPSLPEDYRRVEPELPDRDTGEFQEWQRVVGGILKASGVTGFAANYDAWSRSTDEESEESDDFFEAWRALDLPPIEFKEVVALCGFGGALHDHLPVELASVRSQDLHGKLKAWLRDHKDQRTRGGRRLVREDGRPKRWKVLAPSDS